MTDHVAARTPDDAFISDLRRDATGPVIGVFPGSRPHVIQSLAPVLAGALRRLEGVSGIRRPRIVVGLADDRHAVAAREAFGAFPDARIVADKTTDVIRASDVCLSTSGTVTLEIATVGKPFVIAYRVSPPVHLLGRLLITVPHVGLVNLVAGTSVVPEHVGSYGLESGVARDLGDLLTKDDVRARQEEGLRRVREALYAPGAYDRAAAAILDAFPG
jgi:lipid-A-disaccharide synthase